MVLATTFYVFVGIANTSYNIMYPEEDYISYIASGAIGYPLLIAAYVAVYRKLKAHNAILLT